MTEMLTGFDLVKWQIRIAAGIPLNFAQKDVRLAGCAIECRINAGSCGTLKMLHVPGGPSVRFDTCLIEGTAVSPYYDPLLGKLVVYAKTREETLRKMRAAQMCIRDRFRVSFYAHLSFDAHFLQLF